MKDYGKMNARELVYAIETLGEREGTPRDMPYPDSLPVLESLFRRKAIEEATVAEVEVVITESEDEITSPPGSPDRIVTCNEHFIWSGWIPEGKYRLIRKETDVK